MPGVVYQLADAGDYQQKIKEMMKVHYPITQKKVQTIQVVAYNNSVCRSCGQGSRIFGCVVMKNQRVYNFEATTACLSDGEDDFDLPYYINDSDSDSKSDSDSY